MASLTALADSNGRSRVEYFEERFANDESYPVKTEALRALRQTGGLSVGKPGTLIYFAV